MRTSLKKYWQILKAFGETVSQEAERAFDGSEKQLILLGYFLKLQNTAHSAMILLDVCHVQDARILVRCLFDNMICAKAAAKKDGYPVFFQKDWVRRRHIFSKDLKEYYGGVSGIRPRNEEQLAKIAKGDADTDKVEARLPKDFSTKGFDLESLVKEYELKEQHKLFYQHLHDETHSLSVAVSRHYNKDGFVGLPDTDKVDITAMSVYWMYLEAMESVIDVFSLDHLKARFNELDAERQEIERLDYESRTP